MKVKLADLCTKGRDCIGISQPGSGKTLGFLAPLVAHVKYGGLHKKGSDENSDISQPEGPDIKNRPNIKNKICLSDLGTPTALVIAPTRELAEQIERQIQTFFANFVVENLNGEEVMFRSAVFTGGRRKEDQEMVLRSANEFPHLVVGTPGKNLFSFNLYRGSL